MSLISYFIFLSRCNKPSGHFGFRSCKTLIYSCFILRVAQPTLMDVSIFFILFYITIYVYVPHFYDLSALVGCWSSVSLRRIIYKFLNVRPFDYTAVAVSGKVERS